MKLKVVETMLKYFCINAIVIIVTFAGLLPLEVEKNELAISYLFPILAGGKDFSDEPHIIATS